MKKLLTVILTSCLMSACGGDAHYRDNPPVATGDVVFVSDNTLLPDEIDAQSISIKWQKASDAETLTDNLEYKIIISGENSIQTIDEAERNNVGNFDWIKNIDESEISGLIKGATYYITVLVRDESGGMSMYSPMRHDTIFDSAVGAIGNNAYSVINNFSSLDEIDYSSISAVAAGRFLPAGATSKYIVKDDLSDESNSRIWILFNDGGFAKGVLLNIRQGENAIEVAQVGAAYFGFSGSNTYNNFESVVANWNSIKNSSGLIGLDDPSFRSGGDSNRNGYGIGEITFFSRKRQ
jgi:hypothetical protein